MSATMAVIMKETRVLIVDDQEDLRLLVRTLIISANDGLLVGGEAGSGEEALAQVDAVDPSVIVLDQMMPGMTGLETAAAILERRPDQRIILFSAYLHADLKQQALAVGVTSCVDKQNVATIADSIRAAAA